jgi:hypothetical protein
MVGTVGAGRFILGKYDTRTSLAPLYGWARRSEQVHFRVPRPCSIVHTGTLITAVLMMFERLANSHNGRTNPRRLAR